MPSTCPRHSVMRNCVGYQAVGHGFFLEDATAQYNVLDRNPAVQTRRGKRLPKQALPFDDNDGAGFWWANARGRSRAVGFENLVFAVATAPAPSTSVQEQTRQVLARLEQSLADAGSDKSRLLSATVYLADIARKAELDEAWNEWIGPDLWPQRACVQAGLGPHVLAETTVIAARRIGTDLDSPPATSHQPGRLADR